MALPIIVWTQPLESSPSPSPGGSPTPVSVTEPHILRNDLVTISRKAPEGLIDADGNDIGGQYFARFNDVDRVDNPEVTTPGTGSGSPTTTPAHSAYTFVDRGHISLEGGAFELLPFSSAVSPATTVTFTDFAGTGRSPYPASYTTLSPGPGDSGGVVLCGSPGSNVEVQHSYSISPNVVSPQSDGIFGASGPGSSGFPSPGSFSPGDGTEANPPSSSPATLANEFEAFFGETTGPTVTLYVRDSISDEDDSGFTTASPGPSISSGTTNKISEFYAVGQDLVESNNSIHSVHKGGIIFELRPDTEAIISSGNISKTDTGTASWAAGQDRIMTVTTSSAHGLTDQFNRVFISGSSNTAMNGLMNVESVTSDTQFTVKLLAAQCGPSAITSSVNVVTYDGIDKKGGRLRQQTGTISSIVYIKTINNTPDGTGGTVQTHDISFEYNGAHGLGSSGTKTASVSGSGYSGTASPSGTGTLPAGDFTGSVTINSGTKFTRSISSSHSGAGSGGTSATLASGFSAKVFNASDDLEVVAGGMFGNNQVILKGEVSSQVVPNVPYSFHGNTTSSEVSTIFFTGSTRERTMFHDAGFKLNTTSGRVFTEGAPSTQPSGTDGMPGGFDPNTNPDGGVKEIDSWCPRYMHAKAKAIERNDVEELLKANTSGQLDIDQLLASPMVDESNKITTFLTPRERFHETCWFNVRAAKNPSHRRPGQTSFVENEDFIIRQYGINVYSNPSSDRNEIILDYVDISNKTEVANTDTAFIIDGEPVTNQQHLNAGYANGNFTNQ